MKTQLKKKLKLKQKLSLCLVLALAFGMLPGAVPLATAAAPGDASGLLMMPESVGDLPLILPEMPQQAQAQSFFAAEDGSADAFAAGSAQGGLVFADDPLAEVPQGSAWETQYAAEQAAALYVGQPTAQAGQLSPGDTIQWRLQLEGAASASYAVLLDGALLEEGTLPTVVDSFTWTAGQPGGYQLTVTAWDAQGQSQVQTSAQVLVQAAVFTADLSASHQMAAPGDQVRFVASVQGGTAPLGMRILLAQDGVQVAVYDGGEALHNMTAPGHYLATLEVTDALGQVATAQCEVYCSGMAAVDIASFAPMAAISGDAALDMAQVARSQIGLEAARYGQWYDAAYGGGMQDAATLSGPLAAMFVSYCAHYAAAPLTPAAWLDALREDAAGRGTLRDAAFIPRVGDVALISRAGTEIDAAGVVIDVDGQSAEVVVCDASASVTSRRVALGDGTIRGFIAIAPDTSDILLPEPVQTMNPAGILMEDVATEAPDASHIGDILLTPEQTVSALQAQPEATGTPDADLLLPADAEPGNELFIASEEDEASAITVQSMSPQLLLGETIHWTVQAPQGVQARYTINRDDQTLDMGDVVSGLVSYLPEEVGDYTLTVTAQVDGADVTATDAVRVIDAEQTQSLGDDMPFSLDYVGGTVDRSAKSSRYQSTFARTSRALLADLEIAYVTCNQSTLALNQTATWTIHAEGGTGGYQYRIGLYYQSFGATNSIVSKVTERSYSTSNTFSYNIVNPGRYVLFIYLRDTAGEWLMWESTMYETYAPADVNNETTVTGKVKAIVASETNSGMSTREKARALHDWIILNAEYDYGNPPIYHAEGVLLRGKGVCQSYAQAFRMLCMEAGIECLFVTGMAGTVLHAWNLVNFDGKWLHVDCTWDDTGGASGLRHTYFGLTDAQMRLDHSWNSDWTNNAENRIDGIYPVLDPSYPQNIVLNRTSLTVSAGDTAQLTATVTPETAGNKTVTWETANALVATVDSTGRVTGVAPGQTTITARTHNDLWVRATVTVGTPPALTGLTLSQTGTVSMMIGNTLQLTATKTPSTATDALTWTSSSPGVASVSANGLVSGVAEGSTRITVSAGAISASVTIVVNDPTKPTGITINRASPYAMTVGQGVTLVARLLPSTAVSDITWTSSVPGVATVSTAGRVQAIAQGTTLVVATAERTGHRAVIQVNVTDSSAPTGVTLNRSGTVDLAVNQTLPLTATLSPAGATSDLTWSSSSNAIATVSAQGVVTGVAPGRATITVLTARGGHTAQVTVNVTDATIPTGVSLNRSGTIGMQPGGNLTLTATLQPAGAVSALSWTTSNAAVATVSGTGTVTAVGPGTAIITVLTARGGRTAQVTISVADTTIPTGVSLNRSGTVAMQQGGTLPLVASLVPTGAVSDLRWASSNTAIATVSQQGIVTAVGAGTATITVTTVRGNRTASVRVSVSQSTMPTGITLSHSGTVEVPTGTPLSLRATLQPAGAQSEITWTSTMQQVATVSQQGVVTPLQQGLTTITATATRSGHTASVRIQVIDATRPTGITLNYVGQVTLDLSDTLSLRATLHPATAQSEINWTSSAAAVATVDAQGRVTPHREGSTTITARAVASGHTATVRVQVVDGERPTGITLSHAGIVDMVLGDSLQLRASMVPQTAVSAVRWTSSNTNVATVSEQGLVTPLREGTATITAMATKIGRSAYITVRVTDPYKPTGIALSHTGTVNITTGETLSLTAAMIPQTAQSSVTWRSSSTQIATVENGVVTPLREGIVTITATADKIGRSAYVRVQISDPYKPTGITLSHTGTVNITTAETLSLTATMIPATAQSQVTWRTSSALIATVNNGVVTPLREGTVTITATADKIGRTASVRVQITDPFKPTGISLSHAGIIDIVTGDHLALSAILTPQTATSPVTWRSSNVRVASVDANGVVTPHTEGTAAITATATKINRSASMTVRVSDPYKPTGIALNLTGVAQITTAETLRLTATLTPQTAQSQVTWRSSNPRVATVDDSGLVTPLTEGAATIWATATKTNRQAYLTVRVTDPYKPTGISLSHTGTVQLSTGDTLPLTAQMVPQTAQSPVTWRTSNQQIATVDANGVVTPLREGFAQITATATKTNRQASVRVQVVDPYKPTGIALNHTGTVQLSTAQTLPLVATLTPATAQSPVTWRTSNAQIAMVDSNGVVTPLREGFAQITATADKIGRTASVRVQVTDPNKPTGIYLSHAGTFDLSLYDSLTVRAMLLPQTAQSPVTWRSSNPSVATVDANGRISAVQTGTARISATADKINRTAYVTVRVYDPYRPTGISLDRTGDQTLALNQTMALRAVLRPDYAQSEIRWQSLAPQVATVDANGVVTPLREGVTTIRATCVKTNHSAQVRITVVDPARIASLSIGGAAYGQRLPVGQQLPLSANVMPATARPLIRWISTSPQVASVDASGRVEARQPGWVTIIAASESGRFASTTLQVVQ